MNIEDLIFNLHYTGVNLNPWDSKLVHSFHDQISRGSGLTEKQSSLALKILSRHKSSLSTNLRTDISPFLSNPTFRLPIRKVSSDKKLEIIEHNIYGKAIKAIFPYNEQIVQKIRTSKDEIGQSFWDKDEKCWFFALNEYSIQFLMELAEKENFQVDELFKNFSEQVKEINNNIESYVPMLVIEENIPKFKNSHKNIPELSTTDLLGSIFEARKRGIMTWDETINNFINSDEVSPTTREFLKTDPGEKFTINSEINDISVMETIVDHLFPILVIIPGGDEYQTITKSYEFFSGNGIVNDEISVMFRLPTESHQIFNDFVKQNELNSPLSEKTKVVYVSSKLPKPVLKSKIKFNMVLNLGYDNVHYTLRDFLGKHENLVIFAKEKNLRNTLREFV